MIIVEKLYNISLAVSNLEKSVSFYKDIFGFDITEWQSGSKEVVMQVADIMLRLCEVDSKITQANDESYITFYLDDDDFDEALDQIDTNEIAIVFGPENIRTGRSVIITDLDGNRIGLCSIG